MIVLIGIKLIKILIEHLLQLILLVAIHLLFRFYGMVFYHFVVVISLNYGVSPLSSGFISFSMIM